ncbi:HD-GYP domain-containing protein [Sulfuricella sp.]|uniref:HD-GYP domain-containing protein n=1 Tax=Sulfuricella sp. TaxID=2099377 RepID=UPI002CA7269D|nr:HD-GYP domain-containing protein [Sulfuricella sp.]HUX64488.1 HD-GYP domain-containing protein [Sulfuricella sp.]
MELAQPGIITAPPQGEKRCHVCSAPIASPPFIREGEEYCCEGCFLGRKEYRGIEAERDSAYLALAEALAAALDAREHETGLHSKRVACHTMVLARHFTSDPQRLHQVYWGALLHDLGKIGIPDAILLKSGPLTKDEWAVMRTHPEIGQRILATVPFMAEAAEIVLSHEERFDGSGYPRGLAGDAIPLWARLFAVIDTLDAITSDRPYRKGLPFDAAMAEIQRLARTQFDPLAVEAFSAEEKTLREMVAMKCGMAPIAMEAG